MPAKSFAKDRLRPQQPRLPSLQSIRIAKNKKGPKQKSPFDSAFSDITVLTLVNISDAWMHGCKHFGSIIRHDQQDKKVIEISH